MDEGANLLINVIKINKYRSSLRKLIRKVRMFITNKTFVKKEDLVAFLSNQNSEGN